MIILIGQKLITLPTISKCSTWNILVIIYNSEKYGVKSIVFLVFLGCFATGCRSFDPNPELQDPIYKDLTTIMSDKKRIVEDRERHLELSMEEMRKARHKPAEYSEKRNTYLKAIDDLARARQEQKFFEIRAESRMIWIRKEYYKAFKAGEDYVFGGKNYEYYLQNKELQDAPRMWLRGSAAASQ
ncbi:MAG: hypothetical protein KDD25_06995 [Bdellovibrionales bacterium]|nr:hypothetical protein [Bdellovibrionales bacterium]